MAAETPYLREPGYARRYRDERFTTGGGARTHRAEVRALGRLLARCGGHGGLWLDVPCGAGRLTALLPGPAWQIDRALPMLAACPPGGRRVCASALALPCADGAFAGALCMRLLQHLPSAEERIACLRELRRVTRGPVLVSFFHAGSLQHARRRLRRAFGGRASGRTAITARQFERELAAAGLRSVARAPLRRFVSEQWLVLAVPSEPARPADDSRPSDRSPR
jgi:hypothetical protein